MKRKINTAIPCLLAAIVTGCASGPETHKFYSGALEPGQKPALVKPVGNMGIYEIDGKKVAFKATGSFSRNEYEIELAPGRHVFRVEYSDGKLYSAQLRQLVVNLEPGHKYIVNGKLTGSWIAVSGWTAAVIDVSDRPRCWTSAVGTLLGPSECNTGLAD